MFAAPCYGIAFLTSSKGRSFLLENEDKIESTFDESDFNHDGLWITFEIESDSNQYCDFFYEYKSLVGNPQNRSFNLASICYLVLIVFLYHSFPIAVVIPCSKIK